MLLRTLTLDADAVDMIGGGGAHRLRPHLHHVDPPTLTPTLSLNVPPVAAACAATGIAGPAAPINRCTIPYAKR
jgi:hypothetical protein